MEKEEKKNKGRNKGWDNLRPCKPGQTANPNGRPKGKRNAQTLFNLAIEAYALKILEKTNKGRKVKLTLEDAGIDPELDMWMMQIEKARKGDHKAFEIVMGYVHGKPTQNVNLGGQPDNPIVAEVDVVAEIDEWQKMWFEDEEKEPPKKKKNDNRTNTKSTSRKTKGK